MILYILYTASVMTFSWGCISFLIYSFRRFDTEEQRVSEIILVASHFITSALFAIAGAIAGRGV